MTAKKKATNPKPARGSRAAKAAAMEPVEAAVVPGAVAQGEARPEPEAVGVPVAARRGKASRYQLPANMEIAALGPVHAELVTLEASNDGPFVLDGANLSVIDTAGLQLLISFVSAVQASGKKVSWENYSVQAYQLANELGVVDQLGD